MKNTIKTVTLSLIMTTGLAQARKHPVEQPAPPAPKVYNLTGTITRVSFHHDVAVEAHAADGSISAAAYCTVRETSVDCDSTPGGLAIRLQDGTYVSHSTQFFQSRSCPLCDERKFMQQAMTEHTVPVKTFNYRIDSMRFDPEQPSKWPLKAVWCVQTTPAEADYNLAETLSAPSESCYEIEK